MLKNKLGIFFPSSKAMIKTVIEFANIKDGDVLFDLGSGDGRILAEAAKFKIRVVGIEKNRILNWIARKRLKKFENVEIIERDIFEQNLSDATIIVAYLSRELTYELQEKIEKEVKKGTKIIIIDHIFRGWKPVKIKKVGITPLRLYVKDCCKECCKE